MKLAVIDCGTNTFNLIIADIKGNGDYFKIYHTRVPVKMGERTINGGYIDDQPFQRGLDTLRSFHEKIMEEKADRLLAFGTSAIRDARNGPDFARQVKTLYNIDLQVIDGEREAELVYLAVKEAVQLGNEISLIVDIGGGSAEFILASADKVFWKKSFTVGAARLLAKFAPSDPIKQDEIMNIYSHLRQELRPLFDAVRDFRPVELVGSSGAFESFVEIIHEALGGEAFYHEKSTYSIDPGNYRHIAGELIASTSAQRRNMKGLIPMRVDMIVICCLMVNFILSELNLNKMRMSVWSLKEGAMLEFIKKYSGR